MAKIENDKYYTPDDLAKYCVEKANEIIGVDNIISYIEPSAGAGAFIKYFNKDYLAIDILPEHERVIEQDFLILNFSYKKGRMIIGNPPYGRNMSLAQKFYKKSIELADYIAFILPISQLNNTNSLYEFDLIYSEDLGIRTYSNIDLHCCFNVYKRPENGLNKKKSSKLKDITIYRQDKKGYEDLDFDIRMCYWGNGCAGKILKDNEHYSAEYKIKINNDKLKKEIINTLSNFDWKSYLNCIAARKIQQFHIIDVLKNNIPEIK
jgi:hypothetical protein